MVWKVVILDLFLLQPVNPYRGLLLYYSSSKFKYGSNIITIHTINKYYMYFRLIIIKKKQYYNL